MIPSQTNSLHFEINWYLSGRTQQFIEIFKSVLFFFLLIMPTILLKNPPHVVKTNPNIINPSNAFFPSHMCSKQAQLGSHSGNTAHWHSILKCAELWSVWSVCTEQSVKVALLQRTEHDGFWILLFLIAHKGWVEPGHSKNHPNLDHSRTRFSCCVPMFLLIQIQPSICSCEWTNLRAACKPIVILKVTNNSKILVALIS